MTTSKDRPPILRFLLMFAALLALATGLAALSYAAHPTSEPLPGDAQPEPDSPRSTTTRR